MDSRAGGERAGSAPISGALALILMPFTFTRDDLLDSRHFIKAAEERGHKLSLDDLQAFHNSRLLLPLYRVSDTPVSGRRIDVVPNGNLNDRYQAQLAAAEGRLRDSGDEGYSVAWPYRRPADETRERWWNGFLYSSWQLLDLRTVRNDQHWLALGVDRAPLVQSAGERHKRTLALAALAPRNLPGVLGTLRMPPGLDWDKLERFRFESDALSLLHAVGFDPGQLKGVAEQMLAEAHGRDPMSKWLPILRHANHSAWTKLQGEPLDCMWLRIAAEVLLRAHEDLASGGQLQPLPSLTGQMWWTPFHDRLSRTDSTGPLEQVLGSFGLSPHPRVLLIVEGKTELIHAPRLLTEFGLSRPEQVRVQVSGGASTNPQLLARYAVTPRLGRKLASGWQLSATPTALVIAMDPENRWSTPQKRDAERKKIRKAIREEVELQGGQISDDDLDFLVNVHVYDQYYELANFTDDELLPALEYLASGPLTANVGSDAWRAGIRTKLQEARQSQENFDTVIGPLRITKTALAEALWPVLLNKVEREPESNQVKTPLLEVVLEVRRLVALLSAGGYMLPSSSSGSSSGP